MSKQYVVSACLAGESCRYDGRLLSLSGGTRAGPHRAGPTGARKSSGASDAARVPSEIRAGVSSPKTERT